MRAAATVGQQTDGVLGVGVDLVLEDVFSGGGLCVITGGDKVAIAHVFGIVNCDNCCLEHHGECECREVGVVVPVRLSWGNLIRVAELKNTEGTHRADSFRSFLTQY